MYENVQVRKNLFVIFLKQHEGYHTFNLRSPSCDCIVCRQNNLIFVFPRIFYLQRIVKSAHTQSFATGIAYPVLQLYVGLQCF